MKLLSLLCLVPAVPLLLHCSHGDSPVRTGLLSAALGLSGLAAAAILSPVTGLPVAVNFFNTAAAVLLGLPGVAGMMILSLIS